MPKRFRFDAFISYCRSDADWADKLKAALDEGAVNELVDMVQEPQVRLLYADFQDLDDGVPWRLLVSLAHLASAEHGRIPWESIASVCRAELGMKAEFTQCGHALALLKNSQIVGEEQTGGTLSFFIRPDILRIWLRSRHHFVKERISRSDIVAQA